MKIFTPFIFYLEPFPFCLFKYFVFCYVLMMYIYKKQKWSNKQSLYNVQCEVEMLPCFRKKNAMSESVS